MKKALFILFGLFFITTTNVFAQYKHVAHSSAPGGRTSGRGKAPVGRRASGGGMLTHRGSGHFVSSAYGKHAKGPGRKLH